MIARKDRGRRCFIDTNIWLYAFIDSNTEPKRTIAKDIVQSQDIVISTQVINETCVNLLKNGALTEEYIRQLVLAFYEKYTVVELGQATILLASKLRERYSLSFWDSMIVASALHTGCAVLYTEDMQNGLLVAEQLTIVNPLELDQS